MLRAPPGPRPLLLGGGPGRAQRAAGDAEGQAPPGGCSLEALLKSARPEWSSKAIQSVIEKLAVIGITSVPVLIQALRCKEDDDLNARLRAAGQKSFTADTLQALAEQAAKVEAPRERRGGNVLRPDTRCLPVFFRQGLQERCLPVFFRQGLQERPSKLLPQEPAGSPRGHSPPAAAADDAAAAGGAEGSDAARPPAQEKAFYVVDNSKLQAPAEGLGRRRSKRMEDKDEQNCITWGKTVYGVDEGDGWVRVDNWYLPMTVGGVPVLVEDTYRVLLQISGLAGELCQVYAHRSWFTRDLKLTIAMMTGIPRREQQLFVGDQQLDEAEDLDDALPSGRCLDITLVRANHSPEQRDWLERVEIYGMELQDAPQSIKGDYGIVCAAVRQNGRALEFASEALRADRQLVQVAVRADGSALGFAADVLQADPDLRSRANATRDAWLKRVQANGMELGDAPTTYTADKEIALAAVCQSGWALEFVSESLKADREIVVAAVKGHGRAVRHAAPELLADREVVLAAVQASGHALELVDEDLKADKEIVLAAVRQDGSALAYADDELRSDREVVLAAIRQTSAAVNLAGALWQDAEIRSAVAQQHGDSVALRTHWGTTAASAAG